MRAARAVAVVAALAALATGCVSEVIQPAAKTDLFVTRAGEVVNLQWQSEKGRLYTVTASDALAGGRWQPLPSAVRLPGTGGTMALQDRVPAGRPRYYDLVVEPAAAR